MKEKKVGEKNMTTQTEERIYSAEEIFAKRESEELLEGEELYNAASKMLDALLEERGGNK